MEGVPAKILGRATLMEIDFIWNFSMCSADLSCHGFTVQLVLRELLLTIN